MKKFFVLLPFGLLGGVITFLGGLAGKVEFSILAVRSLLAVIISIVFLFGLLLLLSRTLFQGVDIFQTNNGKSRSKNSNAKKHFYSQFLKLSNQNKPKNDIKSRDNSEEGLSIANHKHQDENTVLNVSESENEVAYKSPIIGKKELDTAESQLREADTKELANLVRHSMSEGL